MASSYGILPSTIDNTLDDAFGQRIVSTIYTSLNQYHVVLEVDPKFQYGPEALSRIYVPSSSGQQVPLSTLVNAVIKAAPIVVNHQGMFPSATISFNLKPGVALGDAVSAISGVERELGKPQSLAAAFQGNAQAFQSSLSGMPILIAAALVVIYIILGVLYENAIHPITILSTLPSAGIGALLLLLAVRMDLSVMAMLGIILLIGIVKKNGIMLVDFALEVEQTEKLKPEDSIRKACLLRFRPILMTTMAAVLAAVPLMLGTGTGSEIRQPLGYTIVGGLALSHDLSVMAMLGIILLIGIVKKNGIMLVDFALEVEQTEKLGPEDSIRKACLLRFRPILMTTMAAMLAAVPLMLGTGTGSEIRQPLGYTIVGGLALSQILTLFTTPVVYLYLDRLNALFTHRGRSAGKVASALK